MTDSVFDRNLPKINRQEGPEFAILDEAVTLIRQAVRDRLDDYYALWRPLTCPVEKLDVLAQDIGLERSDMDGDDQFFRHKVLRFAEICRAKGTGFALALMLKVSGIELRRLVELWEVIDNPDPLETHYVEERPSGTPGTDYGRSSKFSLEIASDFVCFTEDQIDRIIALVNQVKPLHATLLEILATRAYQVIARAEAEAESETVARIIINLAPWNMDSDQHPEVDNSGRVKMSCSLISSYPASFRRPGLDCFPPMDLNQIHLPPDETYGLRFTGGYCLG